MAIRQLSFATFGAVLLVCSWASAGVYDPESDELVLEFASSVALEDLDNDGSITDMDFSIWVIERVFSRQTADLNCDGVINITDGVLALATELAGLTADFDDSDLVEAGDVSVVVQNLGASDVGAAAGDLTGDSVVDADDLAVAAIKVGQIPAFDPIGVAAALLDPLIAIDPLAVPLQLPPNSPCPQPELCGNATCKAKCYISGTTTKWTYRLFMIGFCGSQMEADNCCQNATAVACGCSSAGFKFECWLEAQGVYIVCLLAIPG